MSITKSSQVFNVKYGNGLNMLERIFAQKVKYTRRDSFAHRIFCTRQFCTKTLLHERLFFYKSKKTNKIKKQGNRKKR